MQINVFVFCITEHNRLPAYTWKDDIKQRELDAPKSKLWSLADFLLPVFCHNCPVFVLSVLSFNDYVLLTFRIYFGRTKQWQLVNGMLMVIC